EGETGLAFRTASGWGARREARSLVRDYDVVVIDTPPKSDLELRSAFEVANLVAVPLQPSPVDIWASDPTLQTIAKGALALRCQSCGSPRAAHRRHARRDRCARPRRCGDAARQPHRFRRQHGRGAHGARDGAVEPRGGRSRGSGEGSAEA